MRTSRRLRAAATALAVLAASVVGLAAAQPAGASARQQALVNAYDYATNAGYHVGLAVLDTQTGRMYSGGDHAGPFASESVVKTMIATRIFVQGRLYGSTASRVYTMITQSDDAIASSLYGGVGGDSLINWVKSYFHVPNLGTPPVRAGWWGGTRITADGLVAFYAKVKAMRSFGPWLINAMQHATQYGSDGFYQWFGLKAASSTAAIKQGWGFDYTGNEADENTTGFVDNARYAVAILARGGSRTYGGPMATLLSNTAKRLLPGGTFPPDGPVITAISTSSGRNAGGQYVVVHGTDFTGATKLLFGGVPATHLHLISAADLSAWTPAHPSGAVRVQIVTPAGTSPLHGPIFTFHAPPVIRTVGPTHAAPGGPLTITGAGFVGGKYSVHVGPAWVTPYKVSPSGAAMSLQIPDIAPGPVYVVVVTIYGASAPARFTVDPSPARAAARARTTQPTTQPPTQPPTAPTTQAPSSSPSTSAPGGPSSATPSSGPTAPSSGSSSSGPSAPSTSTSAAGPRH